MQLILNILIAASLLMLAGASFSLPFRITKAFDFSHGILFTIAPFVVWTTNRLLGWPFPIGVAAALTITCVVGICLGAISFKAVCKGAQGWQVVVGSLGAYVVLQNLVSVIFGDDPRFLLEIRVSEGIQVFGGRITVVQLVLVTVSIASLLILQVILRFTARGKMVEGAASNRDLCVILGINPVVAHTFATVCGSLLAAITGILIAVDTGFTPASGFRLLMGAFVVVVVGGLGSVGGMLIGACLIASAQHLAAYYIDSRWADPVAFLILIAFLIWKPLGFSGRRLKKIEI